MIKLQPEKEIYNMCIIVLINLIKKYLKNVHSETNSYFIVYRSDIP